jgi:hypothetical protein
VHLKTKLSKASAKAFGTVPREALFAVLRRFGLPDHFVEVLMRLHFGAKVKVKIGKEDSEVDSTIGVRQGSCEGPVLSLFIIEAAIETLQWPDGMARPEFKTRKSGVTMGRNSNRKRDATPFELWASLFADDCALLFNSRDGLITGPNHTFAHLRKFGIQKRAQALPTLPLNAASTVDAPLQERGKSRANLIVFISVIGNPL